MKIEIGKEVLKAFHDYTKKQKLTLKEIYDSILENYPNIIGEGRQYANENSFKAGVRNFIETHSSDSDVFSQKKNKKREDLFYSVLGKGKGLWGVRENRKERVGEYNKDRVIELEKKEFTKIRLTQSIFRSNLLKIFENQCPISGISIPSLLVASHIKPWAESNDAEKMDGDNGILLSVHMDALFDKGLISFLPDTGEIIYLDDTIRDLMNNKMKDFKLKIEEKFLTERRKKYLKWHIEYHNLIQLASVK
ncbi:HNH endonuclease [Capnocytophaga canimorsus]|uniref:HNH endonuclease n=1 Tax=Capnocytophaga canimorsus TaxID=28188 RepID=UPI0015622EC4|nr:HNH endonuclease signature motif containing protein [Capnocytophaga canimorsus]